MGRTGFETKRLVTVIILFCVLAIPLFAVAGCGEQLARMEENQVKLQAMVAANARELATISSQLHTGQGKINESIQTLDGDTQQVAAGVVSVQNTQRRLQDEVAAGNEGLNRRIGYVEDNQRSLQGRVTQVSDVTQRTAADLTSLAREHAALHETVRANQQELAGSLGTVVNHQQRIQTGIGDLRQASTGLAGDIANMNTLLRTMATDLVTANSSLKEQLGTNQESLTAQITGLAASQQHLQAGVDTLGGRADQTAAELADTRSSLQDTLRVSREVLTGQMAASLQSQQALHNGVRDLHDKADKLTTNIGEVSTEQAALRETLRTHHDAVVTAMAGLSDSQEAVRGGLDRLDTKADRVADNVASMTAQQQSLYEAVKANHDVVATKLADLSATTGQTARDVVALNNGQTTLQQSVNTGNGVLTARATELAANQQGLKSGIDNLGQATQRVASDLATVAAAQDVLRQTLKAHSDKTSERATTLANIQQEMKSNLDTLTAVTGQASLDILALGNNQTGSTEAIRAGVADLGTRADKVAVELNTVAAGQSSLHDTLNRQGQTLSAQMAEMASGRQQTQTSLDTLTATTGQTALDILGMATRQDAIQATLQSRNDALSAQMAHLADGQQQMQGSLDTLTATAGQTGLDVIAMTARQDAIRAALQSHDEASGTQMAQLADNQQQMQNGLDTVTATTGQASLDALALNHSQGQLGQAVHAGRQEMANTLAAMAQGQQSWSDRLDAAQAKVATIADSIAALERQIANLQGVLQTGMQGTATILGATGQQRLQFEAKVSQDMQAVIDSLGQLRQTQASLQEQITQVQKSTQGQADSIRSVIEQMKTSPNANRVQDQIQDVKDRVGTSESKQPAAEVRISNAAEVPQAPETPEATE
jgi:uncharacterized phage infection (PIP) family protein YhgE